MNVVLTTTWTEQRPRRILITWGFGPNSTSSNWANSPIVPPRFGMSTMIYCPKPQEPTTSVRLGITDFLNWSAMRILHCTSCCWLVSSLQEDESMASTVILQASRGQPPKKRIRRTTVQLQSRLPELCEDRRNGLRTVEETLSGLGHNVHYNRLAIIHRGLSFTDAYK